MISEVYDIDYDIIGFGVTMISYMISVTYDIIVSMISYAISYAKSYMIS